MITPAGAGGFESPSLAPAGDGGPAYEVKFLLDEPTAREVEARARGWLAPDAHGDPALGGDYHSTSLYCDTAGLDVYRRAGDYKGHKLRVRRYGCEPRVFLERKAKEEDRVHKRRTPIPLEELALLTPPAPGAGWSGSWFHRGLTALRLSPACRVAYRRTAFAGSCAGGTVRLTLDRHLCGAPTADWRFDAEAVGRPLLPGRVILELKFRRTLPAAFADLVGELGIRPNPVSKYRLCREAWGVSPLR